MYYLLLLESEKYLIKLIHAENMLQGIVTNGANYGTIAPLNSKLVAHEVP